MRKIVAILLTGAALIAFNCSALEDALQQEAKGTVKDSSGAGVSGATVTLYAAADNLTAVKEDGTVDLSKLTKGTTATTGSDGTYSVKVTAGAYIFIFSKSCYADVIEGIPADRKPTTAAAKTVPGTVDATLVGGCTSAAPGTATTAGSATSTGSVTGTGAGSWTWSVKDSASKDITGTSGSPTTGVATGVATVTYSFSGTLATGQTTVLITDVKIGSGTNTRTLQPIKSSSTSAKYVIAKNATVCFGVGVATDVNDVSTLVSGSTDSTLKCGQNSSSTTDKIIAIQSWDTDGTDVDLHALDIGTTSTTNGKEIYWGRTTVDGLGSLDLDNQSGFGPETITITGDTTVKFGSHAWSVSTATNVTLRVICPGANYDKTFKKTDFSTTTPATGNWIIYGSWSSSGEST